MPIIYQQLINTHTKIGVWHITEDDFFFQQKVDVQRNITHPHKRLQHLAGRYLLKALFPNFPTALIQIADTKKPFLEDEAYHFSISHCDNYAAVIVSKKNRVGIDIETENNKIEKIKHKFLTEKEFNLFTNCDSITALTMAWNIKEAVFKWYGLGQINFINHIHIVSVVSSNFQSIACVSFTKNTNQILTVSCITLNKNNLAWIVTE